MRFAGYCWKMMKCWRTCHPTGSEGCHERKAEGGFIYSGNKIKQTHSKFLLLQELDCMSGDDTLDCGLRQCLCIQVLKNSCHVSTCQAKELPRVFDKAHTQSTSCIRWQWHFYITSRGEVRVVGYPVGHGLSMFSLAAATSVKSKDN